DVKRDVNGLPLNPVRRKYPRNYIRTGISAIDGLTTLIRPGPYRVTARKWAIRMNSALISPLRGQLPPRGKPFFVSEYCFLLGERV
ncbi:hypothetical protein, partial [Gemmiger formicilis]|uniref:hypothetical protein n=1 Tax=Gemmiger formicilis TaxID=745368 RepID=UPI003AB1D89A